MSFVWPPSVHAATKTWSGGRDGNLWSDPSNWSPAGVPVNGDDIAFDVQDGSSVIDTQNDILALTVSGISI